jgi:hypothetical protein
MSFLLIKSRDDTRVVSTLDKIISLVLDRISSKYCSQKVAFIFKIFTKGDKILS